MMTMIMILLLPAIVIGCCFLLLKIACVMTSGIRVQSNSKVSKNKKVTTTKANNFWMSSAY